MEKCLPLCDITQCNKLLHEKTRHPLISVIELCGDACTTPVQPHFYALLVRLDGDACHCRCCDYSDGTLIAMAPQNIPAAEAALQLATARGYLLVFHPCLLHGLPLEQTIDSYSYFRFKPGEALHLSQREKATLVTALLDIRAELQWGIDEYSRLILVNKLEMLLNYCMRYYKRQFITRQESNALLIARCDEYIEAYFAGTPGRKELPAPAAMARSLNLSEAYLDMLLTVERGHNAQEYIRRKRLDYARRLLLRTTKPINTIAYELGFSSPQTFCRMFKRLTGYAPHEYRLQN